MNKYIEYRAPTDATLVNQLACYVDTSHADSDDLRTTLGYVVYLNGGPVSWRTMLSKTHCQSPTESDAIQNGDVDIVKIKTDDQIADVMTKALPKRTHWKHTNKLVKDVSVTMGR